MIAEKMLKKKKKDITRTVFTRTAAAPSWWTYFLSLFLSFTFFERRHANISALNLPWFMERANFMEGWQLDILLHNNIFFNFVLLFKNFIQTVTSQRLSCGILWTSRGSNAYSGMSTMVVIPPAAAARVAVVYPSQLVLPGSFTCTWASTTPGMISRFPTSWTWSIIRTIELITVVCPILFFKIFQR